MNIKTDLTQEKPIKYNNDNTEPIQKFDEVVFKRIGDGETLPFVRASEKLGDIQVRIKDGRYYVIQNGIEHAVHNAFVDKEIRGFTDLQFLNFLFNGNYFFVKQLVDGEFSIEGRLRLHGGLSSDEKIALIVGGIAVTVFVVALVIATAGAAAPVIAVTATGGAGAGGGAAAGGAVILIPAAGAGGGGAALAATGGVLVGAGTIKVGGAVHDFIVEPPQEKRANFLGRVEPVKGASAVGGGGAVFDGRPKEEDSNFLIRERVVTKGRDGSKKITEKITASRNVNLTPADSFTKESSDDKESDSPKDRGSWLDNNKEIVLVALPIIGGLAKSHFDSKAEEAKEARAERAERRAARRARREAAAARVEAGSDSEEGEGDGEGDEGEGEAA